MMVISTLPGEKKRIVKVSGHRISLDHIESRLSSLSIENAITNNDEKILVFITNSSLQSEVTKELNFLGIGNTSFKILLVERIPLNGNGKVDYSKLSANSYEY